MRLLFALLEVLGLLGLTRWAPRHESRPVSSSVSTLAWAFLGLVAGLLSLPALASGSYVVGGLLLVIVTALAATDAFVTIKKGAPLVHLSVRLGAAAAGVGVAAYVTSQVLA